MRYKLKSDKLHYNLVTDWADRYDYEFQDTISRCAGRQDLLNKPTGFRRIDWNQWDSARGGMKDMYIEFTDLKLELVFLCSVPNCIDYLDE